MLNKTVNTALSLLT